jgi:hypothetical protein
MRIRGTTNHTPSATNCGNLSTTRDIFMCILIPSKLGPIGLRKAVIVGPTDTWLRLAAEWEQAVTENKLWLARLISEKIARISPLDSLRRLPYNILLFFWRLCLVR